MGELRTNLIAGHEARAVRRRRIDEVQAPLAADSFAKDAKVGEAGLHPSRFSLRRRHARGGALAALATGGRIKIKHGGMAIRLNKIAEDS